MVAVDGEDGVGEYLFLLAGSDECHTCLFGCSVDVAGKDGEVVAGSLLPGDAVETVDLKYKTFPSLVVIKLLGALHLQAHIVGVVGVDGVLLQVLDQS